MRGVVCSCGLKARRCDGPSDERVNRRAAVNRMGSHVQGAKTEFGDPADAGYV